MNTNLPIKPALDPDFAPAALWNQGYRDRVQKSHAARDVVITLLRPDGTGSSHRSRVLGAEDDAEGLSFRYLERQIKFLLWQRGGSQVLISGCDELTLQLAACYSANGERHFDADFFGAKVFRQPLEFRCVAEHEHPPLSEHYTALGRHLDGCRIGFDLGGSDRKCAALINGKVVYSEEVEWSPYFQSNPDYHREGIRDSLRRAAAHLPRVDAIGGSAAGVYVANEPRVASLFRGVSPEDFDRAIRPLFHDLQREWNGIPFEVVNDGEVTALAGSMSMKRNAVLGISMGTSLAAGYVTPDGTITPWLNELAFAPVDYRAGAPADEWSGDLGCGVQYFSQQGVARLARQAGLAFPESMPLAERLVGVQEKLAGGDERAARIFESIGTCFGYTLAHYADFYDVSNILILGRVTSGAGGELIIANAEQVLDEVFPFLARRLFLTTPDEKMKRHGQAVAAASLPILPETRP